MPSFGHINPGTSLATLIADTKYALRSSVQENGTVTEVWVDLQNAGAAIQVMRVGIYNDAPTISGASLIDVSDAVLISAGAGRAFYRFTGVNALVVAGSVYWLTIHGGAEGGNVQFGYDPGVGQEIIGSDTWNDGLSATFGTASSAINSPAIFAVYTAVSSFAPGLKRVTLGRKYAMVG